MRADVTRANKGGDMSVEDYTDRLVENLLAGGLVTCLTMSAVEYFSWFDAEAAGAGIQPKVTQVCLIAAWVASVVIVLPWLWHILARFLHKASGDTQVLAGARRDRVTGGGLRSSNWSTDVATPLAFETWHRDLNHAYRDFRYYPYRPEHMAERYWLDHARYARYRTEW
jgi:hypothetical protein